MTPTVGRFVHYVLTEQDAATINKRRADAEGRRGDIAADALGYVAHVGNKAEAGQIFPLLITRVWSEGCVNGQLFLDGNDTLWKTSASKATEYSIEQAKGAPVTGTWSWPPRT